MTPIQVRTVPRFAGGRKLLYSSCPGPVAEADTSRGLEYVGWAVWIGPDNVWRWSRIDTQPPAIAPIPDHLADVPGLEVDHVSACWNQNARRVIAWERAGACTISFVDPGPPETPRRVTWPGVDPILFFDGWLLNVARGAPTDIIVFYLSLDRRTVHWRRQGEHYATEHTWGVLPEPASLDAVGRFNNQVALYFSTLGEPEGAGALISDPYPFEFHEFATVTAGLISGVYAETVIIRDPVNLNSNLAAALHAGAYTEVVVARDPVNLNSALAAALHAGAYTEVVVARDPVNLNSNLAAALQGGDYVLRTTGGGEYAFSQTLTAGLIGGNYAPG